MFLGGSACVAEVKIEIGFSSFLTKIPLLFHCDMLKIYLHIYITNILRLNYFVFFLIPSRISISSLLHPRLLPQMWYFVQTSFSSLYGFDYFWDPRRPIPAVSLPVWPFESPALNGDLFLKWIPKFLGFPNPLEFPLLIPA